MLNKFLRGGAAVALACGLGALGASPALAASAKKQVDDGIDAAAIPHAKVFGNTPANTPETVSFVFKEQNLAQLEAQAQSGFSSALSVSQFAAEYGQPQANIRALQNYLAGDKISTTVYPDNVDVVATGTAGAFDKALSVTQQQYTTPAVAGHAGSASIRAQSFHGVSSNPSLPSSIAQNLVAILGLTNYAPSVSNLRHVSATLKSRAVPASISESTCEQLSGDPSDCNLPSDFASNYGLDQLYKSGASGAGQTLAIITLATVDAGAPQYFWKNIANVNRTGTLSYQNVDGGAGAPSADAGSIETDLDIEQSGSIAPGANVVVYTAPNTDSGFVDAFFTAASQDSSGSASTSWGEAETLIQAARAEGAESSGYEDAFDEALLEFDAQKQASFVASGDAGAYDANGEFAGTDQPTNLSVDSPSDSPYTTAAGGTTLAWSGAFSLPPSTASVNVTVPKQRTWGWDYLWQPTATLEGTDLLTAAESNIVGSGGGFSAVEPEPSYQQGVSGTSSFTAVPWLTPTDYTDEYGISLPIAWTLDSNPSTITGTATGRAMPDLAADADPYTGYVLYAPSLIPYIGSATEYGSGGTSFVAPELNGAAAVIDSYVRGRVGFWNPSIYTFAKSGSSPFTPLGTSGTSNDNLYYSGTPGALFDPGAGLGVPNLSKLAADFKSAQ